MHESLKNQVRREVMAGRQSAVRELIINDDQIDLIRRIGQQRKITAAELANEDGLTIQNASSSLERLHQSGYLVRRSVGRSSGSIVYVYESYWDD